MNILSYFFVRTMTALALCVTAAFPVAADVAFKFAEWKTTALITLPTADDESGTERTAGGYAGLRLSFAHADARCYVTLPKTPTATLSQAQSPSALYGLCDEPRYGAAAFLGKGVMPLSVRVGTLGYGLSLSRLKNPPPATTANPLAKSFGSNYGLGATLPTLTSGKQPPSAAVALELPPGTVPLLCSFASKAEAAASDNGTLAASIQARAQLGKSSTVRASVTAGRFFLESSTTLARAGAGFESDWYTAALAEASVAAQSFKAQIGAAVHQSPYGEQSFWVQGAARTGFQCFLLDASFFAVPAYEAQPQAAPLIGASSAVCRTRRQVGIHPQFAWLFADSRATTLRVGFHALVQEKVTATKYADSYETCKLAAGASIENTRHVFKATATAANVGTRGAFHTAGSIPSRAYSASASYTLATAAIHASVSAEAKHYPAEPLLASSQEKNVYTMSASASPGKKRRLTAQAGATATYKGGERTSGAMNAAVTATFKTSTLRTTLKCAVTLPF